MELAERIIKAIEGMLKALQGEPVIPRVEVAKGELSRVLAELREKIAEEPEPEPTALELGAAARERERRIAGEGGPGSAT